MLSGPIVMLRLIYFCVMSDEKRFRYSEDGGNEKLKSMLLYETPFHCVGA